MCERQPWGRVDMSRDIDAVLRDWPFRPGEVLARVVRASDGRQVVQMRLDLGLLQLEMDGRPDGSSPHGYATYLAYLRGQAQRAERAGTTFILSQEQCQEADREFLQYYHRRVCWLQLQRFDRAMADADHTLAFMDFVRDHSPSEEYIQEHERYRGFVLYHRTQAAAAWALQRDDPEGAIDAIRGGLEQIRAFFAAHNLEEQFEENNMVRQLRRMEQTLREAHDIHLTLREQLDRAVANEEYEVAARLRDQLRQRR